MSDAERTGGDADRGCRVKATAAGLEITAWYDGGYEVGGLDEPFVLTWDDIETMRARLA